MKASLPMDLPCCYYVPDKIREGTVPAYVLEEAINSWDKDDTFPKIEAPPGWSSDWRSHRSIQNWVFPYPRWRALSADEACHYEETWIRLLQFRLGNGDIVPIMYHKDNHDFVIFRIANRLYYFLRGPPLNEHEHRILALPLSVQDLSNPHSLMHLWQTRWRSGPLCNFGDIAASGHLMRIQECLAVLDYLKTDTGQKQLAELSLTVDMRSWSLEDRRTIFWEAMCRWRTMHVRMNKCQPIHDF